MHENDSIAARIIRAIFGVEGGGASLATLILAFRRPDGLDLGWSWPSLAVFVLAPFVIYAVLVRSVVGSLLVGVLLMLPTAWWIVLGANVRAPFFGWSRTSDRHDPRVAVLRV